MELEEKYVLKLNDSSDSTTSTNTEVNHSRIRCLLVSENSEELHNYLKNPCF